MQCSCGGSTVRKRGKDRNGKFVNYSICRIWDPYSNRWAGCGRVEILEEDHYQGLPHPFFNPFGEDMKRVLKASRKRPFAKVLAEWQSNTTVAAAHGLLREMLVRRDEMSKYLSEEDQIYALKKFEEYRDDLYGA